MKLKDNIPVILAFLFLAFFAGYTAGLIQQAVWKAAAAEVRE